MTPPTDRHAILLRDLFDSGAEELEPAHLTPFDDLARGPLGAIVVQPEAAARYRARIFRQQGFGRSVSGRMPIMDSQIG
jgi:hypothetical protein